jgi:hypothetical protein
MRIAFVGKSRSGKSFAANYLMKSHGFKRVAFSDGIRRVCTIIYYYDKHKRLRWETRLRMYDALYKIDPSIWVGYVERRLRTTDRDVVVEDARYINEVQELKKLGFTIVRVARPETLRKRHLGKSLGDHAAGGTVLLHEWFNTDPTDSLGVDYSIYNETERGTYAMLDNIVIRLKEKENESD